MEFYEKLQELRKRRGLTQEELAEALYVSRAAVSKWESGRGYPNIDSLKQLSNFFAVTIDELLSTNEVFAIAEEEQKQAEKQFLDLVFGLLDCSVVMFIFFPIFGQRAGDVMENVSLLALCRIQSYLRAGYFIVLTGMVLSGILNHALQNSSWVFWQKKKNYISLLLNVAAVFVFIISRQPYVGAFLFIFLVIKGVVLLKKR